MCHERSGATMTANDRMKKVAVSLIFGFCFLSQEGSSDRNLSSLNQIHVRLNWGSSSDMTVNGYFCAFLALCSFEPTRPRSPSTTPRRSPRRHERYYLFQPCKKTSKWHWGRSVYKSFGSSGSFSNVTSAVWLKDKPRSWEHAPLTSC